MSSANYGHEAWDGRHESEGFQPNAVGDIHAKGLQPLRADVPALAFTLNVVAQLGMPGMPVLEPVVGFFWPTAVPVLWPIGTVEIKAGRRVYNHE